MKKPPPFVPSCLIAIWLAAGPIGMVCCVTCSAFVTGLPALSTTGAPAASFYGTSIVSGSTRSTVLYAEKFCTTPCDISTIASNSDKGSST